MALETGTYISDLVSTNPVGTDTLDKADDHLRLIKSTVKATFPNISGQVNATHTELNNLQSLISSTSGSGFLRNRVINGDMRIDQRNAGASISTASGLSRYTVDRWISETAQVSKISLQQNAGAVTPPAGYTNYLGVTSLSAYSVAAGDYFDVGQRIEGFNVADLGWGAAGAQPITLSFWVRSSLTGSFGGSVVNGTGTRGYPFPYTISSANTWEYKTVTIPGDTTGTWAKDNSIGLILSFSLGSGSTYSGTANTWGAANVLQPTGSVSVVGTNAATWYITGVQLEAGSVATPFERRQYGQELALCQRYYWRGSGSALYTAWGTGVVETATSFGVYVKLPVTMRAAPTANFSTLRGFDGTSTAVSSFGANYSSNDTLNPFVTCSGAAFTVGRAISLQSNNSTSGWIDASAEL